MFLCHANNCTLRLLNSIYNRYSSWVNSTIITCHSEEQGLANYLPVIQSDEESLTRLAGDSSGINYAAAL